MKYHLDFTRNAVEDAETFAKTGNKALLKKIKALLSELEQHPTTGTGKPEALKNNLSGKWSRRINRQDRLIYSIDEENKAVTVHALKSHYDE